MKKKKKKKSLGGCGVIFASKAKGQTMLEP